MKSVKIKYNSDLHTKLVQAICARKRASKDKMKEFHKQWSDADDSMRAYIHERDIDKERKYSKQYEGKVDYVTLEVPYTYAIIMTAHTYFSSVMLSRSPVWQFTGRHGEPQDAVMALEAVMDYQLKNGYQLPVMYNWIYDLARYSLGVVGVYWEKEEKIVSRLVEEPINILGVQFAKTRSVMKSETLVGYEGNKLFNVRPYDFYPDPRVPIWRFQDGEFCGRDTSEGYSSLLAAEHAAPGTYINLKSMLGAIKDSSPMVDESSARVNLPVQPGESPVNIPGAGFVKLHEMYIKLVPKMWGLSDSGRVEIWSFTLAADKVIIQARPLGCYHDKFPFSVMEGNFGSEEFAKFGMLEVIRPLTDIMTWLINSHFYNVRRALNNQLVIDPSKITVKDLTKEGQRIIRLKPTAYGTDVRTAVHQLQIHDVTRQHMGDVQYIEQMIQRCSAVVDNVMGMPQQGGRRTATESRNSTGWSTSRLRTPVEYNSALALSPMAQMMVSNTQQFMSMERKFAVAGNLLETAMSPFVEASPERIAGYYDFVDLDGTMPIDRLAQANFWKELLMQMSRVPELAMQWDLGGMIAHAMKLQGERNVDRFRRAPQVNVSDPATIAQQVQAGNLIPLSAAGGRGGRAGGRGPGAGPGSTGTAGATL